MSIILNARGEPEIPSAIRRRVEALGEGLVLAQRSGSWWLMQKWRENDPRWEYVQKGEISPENTLDGLGVFPSDIGFDQMPAFIEKSLREYPVRDLKQLAAKFAKGEGEAPVAEELKHEIFDEVIKETASIGRVTGRRVTHKKV